MSTKIHVHINGGIHDGAVFEIKSSIFSIGSNKNSDVLLLDDDLPGLLISIDIDQENCFYIKKCADNILLSENDQVDIFSVESGYRIKNNINIYWRHIVLKMNFIFKTIDPKEGVIENSTHGLEFQSLLSQPKPALTLVNINQVSLKKYSLMVLVIFVLFIGLAYGFSKPGSSSQPLALKKADQLSMGIDRDKSFSESMIHVESVKKKVDTSLAKVAFDNLNDDLNKYRLSKKMDIKFSDNSLDISGEIDEEDVFRLEKILINLNEEYGSGVKITAKIKTNSSIINVRIKKVIGGANPIAILDDGSRLMIGSVYGGKIVESITTESIVFRGDHLVKVNI